MRKPHTHFRWKLSIALALLIIGGGLALGMQSAKALIGLPNSNKSMENDKRTPNKLSLSPQDRRATGQTASHQDEGDAQKKAAAPVTGEDARKMAEEIHRLTNRSFDGLTSRKLENGTEIVDLEGGFQFLPLARKNSDGSMSVLCVDNLDASRNFLEIDDQIADQAGKAKPSARLKVNAADLPKEFSRTKVQVGQTTLTIVNNNAAGVGFNDPTPVAPVGGNTGTTLGQQRLIAFTHAASIWAAALDSNVEIVIRSQFTPLSCTATSAVLGSAGSILIVRNIPANGSFPGAEFPNTFYGTALGNKRFGEDIVPPPTANSEDINANFNVNLGQPGCLTGTPFYLGLDSNHGTAVDLVAVLLHEFGHGLGFQQFASVTSGAQPGGGNPGTDVFARKILDLTTGKTWDQMTNAERVASAINPRKVVFNGARVTADVPVALGLGTPLLTVNSPAAVAGNYAVGAAAFGPALTAAGITGPLALATDPADAAGMSTTDACSPLTNAAAIAGKIALLDRGTCGFTIKVKNAQDAGAIAVIVADNVAGGPPAALGGADATITIPSVRITLADGNTIKAQLANNVNVTLGINLAVRAGASTDGRALLFTPSPVQSGSTISHWDTSTSPNQLMEPAISGDLTQSVKLPQDLTLSLMRDIGWFADSNLNGIADASASATTLASSANPSITGQPVTFTATVAAVAPIIGTPTGTVQFQVDGSNLGGPVALVNGQASLTTSALTQGIRTITATYSGSVDFTASTATLAQTVNRLAVSLADPAVCTGPGGVVAVTATVTNSGNTPAVISFAASLPPQQLLAIPGTCASSVPGINCQVVSSFSVIANGSLAPGQTVTFNYLTQIADGVQTGTQVCVNSSVTFVGGGAPGTVQACTTINCPNVGPGLPFSSSSPVNDQKAGSVLIYNVYTSGTDATLQNTRLSITNVHPALSANVHLFFVDGTTCSVADSYLCLTANQTSTFLASDLDPGTTGYIVAVAVGPDGCPIDFNYLIGDEYVKFQSGHAGNLGAEAISAIAGGLPFCNTNSSTAQLNFDGISYNLLPRTVALDNVPSGADGNDTLLILNRIGGNLGTGAATLINLFGIFYDDAETSVSFGFGGSSSSPGTCQFRSSLSNNFPRITPRFEQFIPAGRSGWAKVYSQADIALLGAMFNFNSDTVANPGAFTGGHNLHKLTLTSSANYIVPVFPPSC